METEDFNESENDNSNRLSNSRLSLNNLVSSIKKQYPNIKDVPYGAIEEIRRATRCYCQNIFESTDHSLFIGESKYFWTTADGHLQYFDSSEAVTEKIIDMEDHNDSLGWETGNPFSGGFAFPLKVEENNYHAQLDPLLCLEGTVGEASLLPRNPSDVKIQATRRN